MTPTAHIRVRKEPYYRREALELMVKRAGFTLVYGAQLSLPQRSKGQ